MPRVSVSGPDDLDPDGRRIWERIASGPRGRVEGPLRIWVKRPALAERAEALGAYCRFGSSLPPRLSELAILITGAHWQASFEWYAHCPLALDAGIAPAVVESIRLGKEPVFDREDEAAAYAFAVELVRARRVTDATYRWAVAALGEASVIDLVGLLGYYALVSMTINAFEVALPEGALDPFEST